MTDYNYAELEEKLQSYCDAREESGNWESELINDEEFNALVHHYITTKTLPKNFKTALVIAATIVQTHQGEL